MIISQRNHQKVFYLVIDCVMVTVAYLLAVLIRFDLESANKVLYTEGYFLSMAAYILVYFVVDPAAYAYARGFIKEAANVIKATIFFTLLMSLLLVFSKSGAIYSRAFFGILFITMAVCLYLGRLLLKNVILVKFKSSNSSYKMMIVTTSKELDQLHQRLGKSKEWIYEIADIIVIDKDMRGMVCGDYKVTGTKDSMYALATQSVVDEVMICLGEEYNCQKGELDDMIEKFEDMGINVNIAMNALLESNAYEKRVGKIGDYPVITYTHRIYQQRELAVKRLLDILGAIVGLLLTGIVTIFVAPAILIESPGPLVFSQIRVGKNGRQFKIYKFRSMYKDAEERKKALMEKNEMQGYMFKMTDDPRITKVGAFIRKTSIDELPQFWNVLKGDMSLVGTRPPTLEEVSHYDPKHKRRLAMKPGITGLWQTSGRSDITDFDEVVRLDCKYIDEWSFGLDIKLLLKTVLVVFKGSGSR